MTPEVYRGFGFPGADDLGNMFQFKRDFEADFCGGATRGRALAQSGAADLATWLARNKDRIPLE